MEHTDNFYLSLEERNAILDLPHTETLIPIHRNHSDIVKFDDEYETGYSSVSCYLKEFLSGAPQATAQRFGPAMQVSPGNSLECGEELNNLGGYTEVSEFLQKLHARKCPYRDRKNAVSQRVKSMSE